MSAAMGDQAALATSGAGRGSGDRKLRDSLGLELGFTQDSRTGIWWGPCHECGDRRASVSTTSWSCPQCGPRTLEATAVLASLDELESWPERPDVPGFAIPEPLPLDALPTVARSAVASVAESLQVPSDLPALFAILCGAAAIGDRVSVRIRSTQVEPLALYGVGIAAPGERKSPVFARMCRQLYDWQKRATLREQPLQRAARDRVDALNTRLASLKKAAAKDPAALDEMEDARRELDAAERAVPASSWLIVDDVTPEKLAMEIADQGGRAAIFAAEGDVLRIFAGRYGKGDPRADLLKKAINGEPTRVSRVGRETIWLPRPILTVGLMIQPSVLGSLDNRDSLEGEGVFARFLFVQPESNLGWRLTGREIPPPDLEAERRFGHALERLLDVASSEVLESGERVPHIIELSDDAEKILFAWEREIEGMLAPGGRLRSISGWSSKLVGYTCRIAAILQLLDRASRGEALPGGHVGPSYAEGAVRIARALTSHAIRVLGELATSPDSADLAYVWRKCQELSLRAARKPHDTQNDEGLTLTTLRRAMGRKSIKRAEDLARLVRELEQRSCLRLLPQGPTGGRPKADRIVLHPMFRCGTAENAESPSADTRNTLSAVSAVVSEGWQNKSDPLDVLDGA